MIVDDFKDREGNWVGWFKRYKSTVFTISGTKYYSMINRCLEVGLYQARNPTYIGCKSYFTSLQDFTNWHVSQIGYNYAWELDKDLLIKGNKIYSRDTCILLPHCVNASLPIRNSRGRHLISGVYKSGLKFYSKISIGGKQQYLGRFNTPEEAFNAYKIVKEANARVLAEEWKSQIDPRAYQALMSYEVLITD